MSGEVPIEFCVLGPIEIRVAGRPVALGGAKQRALLALLMLRAGEVVSVADIVDELWAQAPPASAAQSVQMHVSRLRRVLDAAGASGVVVTRPAGYVLEADGDRLDLRRFERLVEQGRASRRGDDLIGARAAFTEALTLWRGEPVAGVKRGASLMAEASRLEELRLSAQLARVECDLALGREADVIGELEALARRHALQERIRALLMVALYRSGRQAEALDVYRQTRVLLVEEVGLEPSLELQELQRRILRQDPTLEPAAPVALPAERPAAHPPRAAERATPTWRARRVAVSAALAVAALTAVALALLATRGSEGGLGRIDADAVGVLDPATGEIRAQVATGGRPVGLATTRGAVWLADGDRGSLVRIDPRAIRPVDTVPIGPGTTAVAAGAGSVWAVSSDTRELAQVNVATNTVVRRIGVGNGARAVAVGEGAVWVVNALDATVAAIDPQSGGVMARIPVGAMPSAVAAGAGAVWVANETDGTVTRIDPRARAPVATIRVGSSPGAIAVTARDVWVANAQDGTVSRIDPVSNAVTATTPVGPGPVALAASANEVWAASAGTGTVSRLAAGSGQVAQTIRTGSRPSVLAAVTGRLWVAAQAPSASHRGGTLLMTGDNLGLPISLDPAVAYSDRTYPLLAVVADGLVGHRRVGGAAGAAVIPDLARDLPAPGDGGLTYRFQLRPGLRYSTGAPVRARDVRASIERLHRMGAITLGSYPLGVVGEQRCSRRRCDLSAGIETDDATGTVTFRLRRPNPDFLLNLATPPYSILPAGAALHDLTGPQLVGTGPYRVTSFARRQQVTLVRNPRFRARAPAAQPDGFPDRIVWRLTRVGDPGATRAADVVMDPSPAELRRLRVAAPARVRLSPFPGLVFVWLNTRVPPFDRVDARRAVAYATDRPAVMRGLPALARPLRRPNCQLLPPGLPGYEPSCPFGLRPRSGSAATAAPDLDRARRLVARSRTAGTRVAFRAPAGNQEAMGIGRSFVRLLRSIGYHARLAAVPQPDYHARTEDPRERMQMGWAVWLGESPVASNIIPPLLSCKALRTRRTALSYNQAQFCDPALESRMERAHALEASEPAAAGRLWAHIDQALVRRAPVIPLYSGQVAQVTSPRVGNYQYHPRLGPLLAQAWLR